ncbi:MAG: TIGR03089 family protein, partial [Pseudonocardiaceae bacterium]|nr:TIGR03089 family protein [Pseudonocardiaceae bacterium]
VDSVLATARARADQLGFTASSRVLSSVDWPAHVLDGLVAVLAAGASLVQVTNSDAAKLAKHGETERTTAVLT